uniref:Copper transport protein n=1 Tax=Lygus hesperus TaxID=30085 RepID=A0A0A9WI95_LYGHE
MNDSLQQPGNHAAHNRGHLGHVMAKMTFHGGYKESILFDFWTVESIFGLMVSCVLVATIACLNELMKFSRMKLSANYYERRKPGCDMSEGSDGRFLQNFVVALLGSIQTAISLLLMLITMTYNVWLFASTIIGIFIGQLFVSYKQPLIHYTEEACH